jgi:hypothetical protein
MHRQSATPPTTDPVAATAVVLADDGFSLGVLYRGDCPPAPTPTPTATLSAIEGQFALGG